jgi:hypothetical protein
MNGLTFTSVLLSVLVMLSASCGQSPSFVENTDESKSSNAKPQTGTKGNDGSGSGEGDDESAPPEGDAQGEGDGTESDDGTTGTGSDDAPDGDTDGTAEGNATGGDDSSVPPDIKKTKTFAAESFGDASVTANLADPYLTQEMELKRSYSDTSTTFTQVVRPSVTDLFVQGNSGTPVTETFNQSASKPLDLLVVIDNSNSMQEEQVNLSQRMLPLLSYVSDSDWQIGVVTTDTANGCLRRLIKKGDANAATAFSQAIQAGANGNGNERGVLQAVNALKCQTNNWVRDFSSLAILIVSDEDNCSDGLGCGNNDYAKKEYLLDYLSSIRVPGVNAKVYGLFWHPSQDQSVCTTAAKKANIYSDIVTATSGTWGSICDTDYSNTLSGMSQNIATILDRRFTLNRIPDPGTLQVSLNGVVQTSGYTVTANVVVFDLPPVDGAVVSMSYRHGALPLKKTFTLSSVPLDGVVNVQFNGVPVTSGFEYQAASNSIVFTDLPPDFAQIRATYRKSLDLKKRFDLGRKYVKESLRVYVNNVETTAYTADPAVDFAVTLNTAPSEGAAVLFTYTAVGDPILNYTFSVQGRAAQNLSIADAVTGANVGHVYLLGIIRIVANEFAEGRKLKLRYWNEARDMTQVMLPAAPVNGSVKVVGGMNVCDPSKFSVTNNTVQVGRCGFADDTTSINVQYKYVVAQYTSFVFDDPELGNAKTPLRWRVWVNGVETSAFTVSGTTINLPANLPVGTGNEVKIEVTYK